MSAYVIGLTGGIACGKTNLSDALRKAGAPVVDADEISRSLTAPGGPALPLLRKEFGDDIFDGDRLNRKRLGELVFGKEEALQRLNGILHPLIYDEMRRQMAAVSGAVVLDVPLLYECGLDAWCDEVWCAYLPKQEQIRRLMARDNLTRAQALRRIASQMPTREKARRAQRVISTQGSREESAQIVLSLWQALPCHAKPCKGETP